MWRTQGFKSETSELWRGCSVTDRSHFANIDQLIDRFARGEQLSQSSFRKERVGYAFRSGTLRFYGVFSSHHCAAFVLSHAIIKRHEKLLGSDVQRMEECLAAFDSLLALPAIST